MHRCVLHDTQRRHACIVAGIMNARRTDDLTVMLQISNALMLLISNARQSTAHQADHIVHVLRHKKAASKACKVTICCIN